MLSLPAQSSAVFCCSAVSQFENISQQSAAAIKYIVKLCRLMKGLGLQRNILYEKTLMNMCDSQKVQFRNCLFPSAQEKRDMLKLP